MVPCFLISCFIRFYNQDLKKHLWTDHLSRLFLFVSWAFYIFDMAVKYPVDGAETICEKAFFVHHGASLFIMPPLFLNDHIPWWVGPIGFMHGFNINFPHLEILNYIYALFLMIFHYGIYQEPYRRMWGYNFLRFFINGIWIFALLVLFGNCSNYLPISPPWWYLLTIP